EPLLPPELIELSRWVAGTYACRLVQALRAALPPLVRRAAPAARRMLAVVPAVDRAQLQRAAGALAAQAPRQAEALRRLLDALDRAGDPPWLRDLTRGTALAAQHYRALAQRGLVQVVERVHARDPYPVDAPAAGSLHPPTPDQARVLAAVGEALAAGRYRGFLLEGVTGSGKTEVYLHAVRDALARGRGAIVLVPEISLTPQVIDRFKRALGRPVAVLHSALSDGERHDEWQRIRRGDARVVVGARSAVFAPVIDLGLLILDEEHAPSYKQDETPRYHARAVAEARMRALDGVLLLGSATPSVESAYRVRTGELVHLRLGRRIGGRALPRVTVVDMREQYRRGRRGLLSPPLVDALRRTLSRGRQALLFLNRRGFSTIVLCRECGAAVKCPRCEVTLTYHRRGDRLRCHHCGYGCAPVARCPACGGASVGYFGTGTQRVELAVRELFPGVRVERMDADTVGGRGSHERIYRAFYSGQVDVLVGTQMIARGWDVPGVTLVGVVAADTSLHLPDFRSAERTFELLVQVAGRAGRGDEPGEVLVQTYNPDHYAVEAAVRFDSDAFYARELAVREALGYPPFGHLVRVVFSGAAPQAVTAAAEQFAQGVRRDLQPAPGTEVLGPAPAPIPRLRGRVRWHVLLKGPDAAALQAAVRSRAEAVERAAAGVRVVVDVEPQSML
ncbi:MAG TPA: primosomal protein N', partial [Bacillota bacterium]